MNRSSGILLPVSSLPSPYGIGTLGKEAYAFVDFLKAAGQKVWQILPIGPTGFGDSPYSSFSTYGGNPYFVDLEDLADEGLIDWKDINEIDWGSSSRYVDYGKIYNSRFKILKKACDNGYDNYRQKIDEFIRDNNDWLPDYALFMALKRYYGMRSWTEWEDEAIRLHTPEAIEQYTVLLEEDIRLFVFIQFLFYRQWNLLREYTHNSGISIAGDLPIYVAMDSADVWSNPQIFQLDDNNNPVCVAGVPPDYFNSNGQLWGNPLYNWDRLRSEGYSWWIKRVEGAARLFDIIRIDHFRGLESYWSVPYGQDSAINGEWIKGPGMDFINSLKERTGELPIIAEDLGYLTDEVRNMVSESGYPGMKVLEFAFDDREQSNYLPHTYSHNCVCYTGTHDNETVMGWFKDADNEFVQHAKDYLRLSADEGYNWGMIRGGMCSAADLFIAQMQDYLGLDNEARMNIPGTAQGNWRWRMLKSDMSCELADRINKITELYSR